MTRAGATQGISSPTDTAAHHREDPSTLLAPILVSPFKAFLVRMRCPLLSVEFGLGFSWLIGLLIRLPHFNGWWWIAEFLMFSVRRR